MNKTDQDKGIAPPGENVHTDLVKQELSAKTESVIQTTHDPVSSNIPTEYELYGGIILFFVLVAGAFFYWWQFRKFRKEYSQLNGELSRYFEQVGRGTDRLASPGHSYALASRGPTHSREAEFQSAEARWRHLSVAFPQLVACQKNKQTILLASRPYTSLESVAAMQSLVGTLVKTHLGARQPVVEPSWISALGEDFDALRHPELAIANPAFYTFPFFLTWQRRHQWGVLPYATHTRLGVIVRKDHPRIVELAAIEKEYGETLKLAKEHGSPYWISDPLYVRWLPMLLAYADNDPVVPATGADSSVFESSHTRPTVFSVGAYLHKELLPLACSVLADSGAAADFATKVQELDPSGLSRSGLLSVKAGQTWPKGSAVIVDLALVPEQDPVSELILFRLPHCVYVPIGIGFSVLAWPILAADPKTIDWTYDLLRSAGESLMPAKDNLSNIGIEMDERFWTSSASH